MLIKWYSYETDLEQALSIAKWGPTWLIFKWRFGALWRDSQVFEAERSSDS